MEHQHDHEWVVFSTALAEGWLMVQCTICGAMGTVDDPTKEEWSQAFHAPSRPYRWQDGLRVTIRHATSPTFYVVRKQEGGECDPDCPCKTEVGEYERFPAEVLHKTRKLTANEKRELAELADSVKDSDLCSTLFPAVIEGYQRDAGGESSAAVRQLAQRIDAFHRKGLHFRPAILAMLLREFIRLNS